VNQTETSGNFSQLSYVKEALEDAENLLKFAQETGVAIENDVRKHVLDARAAFGTGLDETLTDNLLSALGRLANAVSADHVTAESLRECSNSLKKRHPYRIPSLILALVVVVYSTLSFVTSSIAESIRNDVATANELALKLTSEFPPGAGTGQPTGATITIPPDHVPSSDGVAGHSTTHGALKNNALSPSALPDGLSRADVIKDLQTYAACVRNIDTHAQELTWYTHLWDRLFKPQRIDPFHLIRRNLEELHDEFELKVPITDYAEAADERTITYQKVRCFAQNMVDDVSFYYGAVSSCVLPVLYALLGAAAYLLRTYDRQVSERTYVHSAANDSDRFLVAAIGGAVVGLFSTMMGNGSVKVPPLALAFLVGYAVDVFYAFLESLIQAITKTFVTSTSVKGISKPIPIEASASNAGK